MLPSSEVMEWESGLFGSQPVWKVEPPIDIVTNLMRAKIQDASRHAKPAKECESTATYFAGGAFNKLYHMDCNGNSWILRVTLPVDPYHKTASEVATTKLIRSFTSLPVPDIVAHYAGTAGAPPGDSCLGLEWILMNKLPGEPLRDVWTEINLEKKILFVESLADKLHELYSCEAARFPSIGNIYQTDRVEGGASFGSSTYTVGRIVSMPFFWNQRLSQPIKRGPFSSSAEWFTSRLQLVEHECTQVLNSDTADSDDKEDAERFKYLSQRLSKHIPSLLPAREIFVLQHDDLNTGNLLVDPASGALTGILDWECVSVLPNWKSCQLPLFLMNERARETKPSLEAYEKDTDGSPSQLYFEHLREWEVTVLRRCFLGRMEKHSSDWIEIYESSEQFRDFESAVQNCDNELMVKRIEKWIGRIESGEGYERLLDC
ncbi:hypothetical protein TWF281_010896 [Arthrobotrys megalospora]